MKSLRKQAISMVSVIIGAVCNIVLDPIFIFGFQMGVKGAALATIISQMLSCVWIIAFLRGKKTQLKIKKENTMTEPHNQLIREVEG